MKKILAVIFCALLSASTFAATDYSLLSLYLGLGFPQIYNLNTSTVNEEGEKADSESYSSVSLNFGGRAPIAASDLGFFIDGNFYAPYSYQVRWGNTTDTYKTDDSNKFWGIEGTFGPYIVLVNLGLLVVPVGAGLHLNYISNETETSYSTTYSISSFSLGAGAFANAELNLGNGMAIYASLHLNYDFWERSSRETKTTYNNHTRSVKETDRSAIAELFVEPIFGVMWRY